MKLMVEGDAPPEIMERWDKVVQHLHGEPIAGDDSILVDVLENFEALIAIQRRAAICARSANQEEGNDA